MLSIIPELPENTSLHLFCSLFLCYTTRREMKYASIFITILLIWVAVIFMAITRRDAQDIFELYIAAIISTLALFLIGFSRK